MMAGEVWHLILFALLLPLIYCSSGIETWKKQNILHTSYFNAPVPNVLRCAKLCEKQEKCIAVSFDVAKSVCYLHETPVATSSKNNKGKYLVRNIQNTTKETGPGPTCKTTQLSVPSAKENGEACLPINEEKETASTPEPSTTTPVCLASCQFDQPINGATCKCMCEDGFTGEYCENPPRDCSDFCCNGYKTIYLPETNTKLEVVCSGFMMYILQFNKSFGAFETYKNASWKGFKSGFNLFGSYKYWIGNDFLHNITTKTNYSYSIVTTVRKDSYWLTSEYLNFVMEDESSNFTIHFSDSTVHYLDEAMFFNNTQFRTINYNSNQCTLMHMSAWWYSDTCHLASPLSGEHSVAGLVVEIDTLGLQLKRI